MKIRTTDIRNNRSNKRLPNLLSKPKYPGGTVQIIDNTPPTIYPNTVINILGSDLTWIFRGNLGVLIDQGTLLDGNSLQMQFTVIDGTQQYEFYNLSEFDRQVKTSFDGNISTLNLDLPYPPNSIDPFVSIGSGFGINHTYQLSLDTTIPPP